MSRQEKECAIDNNRMAIVLLKILYRKAIINQPTFDKTYKVYKEQLKEVA